MTSSNSIAAPNLSSVGLVALPRPLLRPYAAIVKELALKQAPSPKYAPYHLKSTHSMRQCGIQAGRLSSVSSSSQFSAEQQRVLSAHVDGEIELLDRSDIEAHARGETKRSLGQKINRLALLGAMVTTLKKLGVEVEGVYLTGSSVNRVVAEEKPKSDRDFVIQLKASPRADELLKGHNRSLKTFIVATLAQMGIRNAQACFGTRPYTSENNGCDNFLFQFGLHDTDVVINAAPADYAMLDRAWRIDLTDYVASSRGDLSKASLIYLDDKARVHETVRKRLIDPGRAPITWDKIFIVFKRLAEGAGFAQSSDAQRYHEVATQFIEACPDEGGAYLLYQKLSGLKPIQILHGVFEFGRQLAQSSPLPGPKSVEASYYRKVLNSVLRTSLLRASMSGESEIGRMKLLLDILSTVEYEELSTTLGALQQLFLLDALLNNKASIETRYEGKAQQYRLTYALESIQEASPTDSSTSNLYIPFTHTGALTADQVLFHATPEALEALFELAQRFDMEQVVAFIQEAHSESAASEEAAEDRENKAISKNIKLPDT